MGAKADVCSWCLVRISGPAKVSVKIQAAGLKVAESYVSVTEVSSTRRHAEKILQDDSFPYCRPLT